MYFRLKNTKSTPVLQLVESFRNQEGQPRQRILISLGNISIPTELWHDLAQEIENRLHQTPSLFPPDSDLMGWADLILGELEKSGKLAHVSPTPTEEFLAVDIHKISHHDTTALGPCLAVKQAWDQLCFSQILQNMDFTPTEIRDASISIFNRLIEPCSEHSLPSWVQTVALPDLLGEPLRLLGDDRFYRISDKLIDHQDGIERALAKHEAHLFNLDRTIYLYDLSNTYFEGSCLGNDLAQRGGHSKEKRNDAPQMAFGMVLDTEGFILKHHAFKGNTHDSPTLLEMVQSLDPQEEGPMVVMDSGMASEENLRLLKEQGWDYITVGKRPGRLAYEHEFEDRSPFQIIKERDGKDPVFVKFIDTDKERLVCCYSASRAKKERQILSKAESRFLNDLGKLKERVHAGRLKQVEKIHQSLGRLKERHSRVARYYHLEYDPEHQDLKSERIEAKYEQAQQVIGGYILRTNRKEFDEQTICPKKRFGVKADLSSKSQTRSGPSLYNRFGLPSFTLD